MTFTKQDARIMWRNGESPTDILREAIRAGIEYPDAEWLVRDALRLDDEAVEEMATNYMEEA